MSAMARAERSMSLAWRRGLRTAGWEAMERDVAASLLESYNRGRGLYLPESTDMSDLTRFFESARAMTHRAVVENSARREKIADYYGFPTLEVLFLLFFDEDDEGAFRPLERGVPASVARRARRAGVDAGTARRAHEIVTRDPDARRLVRTDPMRSEAVALDEARRALNLGIASSAVGEARNAAAAAEGGAPAWFEPRYPLWEIREVMDERTRGNPRGIYADDGFHWQVNGYVNTMAEIVRQGCVPPCGRNCRARLAPVSWAEAERLGLVNADGSLDFAAVRAYNGERQGYIDRGQYPDPRFR